MKSFVVPQGQYSPITSKQTSLHRQLQANCDIAASVKQCTISRYERIYCRSGWVVEGGKKGLISLLLPIHKNMPFLPATCSLRSSVKHPKSVMILGAISSAGGESTIFFRQAAQPSTRKHHS